MATPEEGPQTLGAISRAGQWGLDACLNARFVVLLQAAYRTSVYSYGVPLAPCKSPPASVPYNVVRMLQI